MRILGVDPGSLITGWGLIETQPVVHICSGQIKAKNKISFERRLQIIHLELKDIIVRYQPTDIVIEDVFRAFAGRNDAISLKMGKTFGACLAATAYHRAHLHTRLANEVRTILLGKGKGRAPKEEVRQHVQRVLKIEDTLPLDTSDSLACALCLLS